MRAAILCLLAAAAPAAAFAQAAPSAADPFASDAFAHFARAFGNVCYWGEEVAAADAYPAESWDLVWDSPYGDGPQTATLYKFHCDSGAYNVIHIWYLAPQFEAPMPVTFAMPDYEVVYQGDGDEVVLDVLVDGFASEYRMINSQFDPAAMTIVMNSYWRGIGDASSLGVWAFEDGRFVLKRFAVDGSYDGEVNPVLIVDH